MADLIPSPHATIPVLVGRDRELARLRGMLATARDGAGTIALVSGEAGIGKTTLIEVAASEAEWHGMRVLRAPCLDEQPGDPLAPWSELFATEAAVEPQGRLAALGKAGALPHRDALHRELLIALASDAHEQPLLLILEDWHWADDASVALLQFIAPRVAGLRLTLVMTWRDTDIAELAPVSRALPSLARLPHAVRLPLRSLDREALGKIVSARYELGAHGHADLVGWLLERSEGNPFFAIELLDSLEHDGVIRSSTGQHPWELGDLRVVRVPPLIHQLVHLRLGRISAATRHHLLIAAAIGAVFEVDLWRAILETDVDELAATIEEALSAHIITEVAGEPAYRFTHALVQAALLEKLVVPRRQAVHRQIGEQLAGMPGIDASRVARHFRAAGDPRAAEWLVRSGIQAARVFAYATAAEHFEAALALFPHDASNASERATLLCELAHAWRFADPDRALQALDAARALIDPTHDPVLAAGWRYVSALVRGLAGEPALDELREAVETYLALTPEERTVGLPARLTCGPSFGHLAQWCARYGDHAAARDLAAAQLALPAETTAAGRARAGRAWAALAMAAARTGQPEQARDHFRQARDASMAARDHHLLGVLLNWEMIDVILPYHADDPGERERIARDAASAWARVEMSAEPASPGIDMTVFALLLLDGRWDEAERFARADAMTASLRFDALRALCELATRRGDLAAAREYLAETLPHGPATPPSNFYFHSTLWLQRLGVELALAGDDLPLAHAWLDAHDRWLAWSDSALDRSASAALRARCRLAGGDIPGARAYALDAERLASTPRQPLALLAAMRLLAELDLATGDALAAASRAGDALEIARRARAPYEIASTQLLVAESALRRDEASTAGAALDEAREIGVRLRALRLVERADALRGSIRASREPDPFALSPRELEVLRLVARGLSNAEVGATLFISPRTVAQHLQSIYNKLGTSTRTAAAAVAFERGLLADSQPD